jgi:hypothetical protein
VTFPEAVRTPTSAASGIWRHAASRVKPATANPPQRGNPAPQGRALNKKQRALWAAFQADHCTPFDDLNNVRWKPIGKRLALLAAQSDQSGAQRVHVANVAARESEAIARALPRSPSTGRRSP